MFSEAKALEMKSTAGGWILRVIDDDDMGTAGSPTCSMGETFQSVKKDAEAQCTKGCA